MNPAHRRSPLLTILLAVLGSGMVGVSGWPAAERAKYPFSQRFECTLGKPIPLDAVVGRLKIRAVTVSTDESEGGHRIYVEIEAENPEGHDQDVRVRVEYYDPEGRAILSDDADKEIEEDEAKTVTLSTPLGKLSASGIAAFLLEVDARDD